MEDKLEVRIVTLPPMRVASAYGYGPSPEGIAVEKIVNFARKHDLMEREHRFFGFDNPMPVAGSPNYGYEMWITVDDAVQPEGDIRIKHFDGGQYAVTRCKLPQIGDAWKALVVWREGSAYECGHHQWLEEAVTPQGTPFNDMVMDIYLPLAE